MIQRDSFFILILFSLLSAALIATYQTDKKIINLLKKPHQKEKTIYPKQEIWITVFVHGMLSHMVRRPSMKRYLNILQDDIDGTLYETATKHIRSSDYYRENQPAQSIGLQQIDLADTTNNPPAALAKVFNELDNYLHKRDPKTNRYYTFGWNGLVSEKKRYEASEKLYLALQKELAALKKQGIRAHIKMYGYSHGGNVALHLGTINKKYGGNLSIDELILLGVPIHNGIDYLILNDCFKKVFHLYSHADRVQKLDILGKGGLFSRRLFVDRKKFTVPKKLKQIRVKMMRNRTTKKQWPTLQDPRRNFEIPSIVSGSSKLLRSISPAHSEWWFFGWTHRGYRRHFPLMPMSMLAMIPVIIDAAQRYADPDETDIMVDLRPDQTTLLVKEKTKTTVAPFLSERKLLELQSITYRYAQKIVTPEEYNTRVDEAVKKARQELESANQ